MVRYSLQYPDPAALYAEVITEPKAQAYLDASITDIQYVPAAVYDTLPAEEGSEEPNNQR